MTRKKTVQALNYPQIEVMAAQGLSIKQIASLLDMPEDKFRALREKDAHLKKALITGPAKVAYNAGGIVIAAINYKEPTEEDKQNPDFKAPVKPDPEQVQAAIFFLDRRSPEWAKQRRE